MNLHGLVTGAIGVVNPRILGSVKVSTGSSITPAGVRVPTYTTLNNVEMQVQPLSTKDLRQVEMLNLQGTLRAIYFFGEVAAIIRGLNRGGDLVVINQGVNAGVWLVNSVLEQWPDWCKTVVTLQTDAIETFIPSLNFSDLRNSQYLQLVDAFLITAPPTWLGAGGEIPVHSFRPSLDFSKKQNSEYLGCLSPF